MRKLIFVIFMATSLLVLWLLFLPIPGTIVQGGNSIFGMSESQICQSFRYRLIHEGNTYFHTRFILFPYFPRTVKQGRIMTFMEDNIGRNYDIDVGAINGKQGKSETYTFPLWAGNFVIVYDDAGRVLGTNCGIEG